MKVKQIVGQMVGILEVKEGYTGISALLGCIPEGSAESTPTLFIKISKYSEFVGRTDVEYSYSVGVGPYSVAFNVEKLLEDVPEYASVTVLDTFISDILEVTLKTQEVLGLDLPFEYIK